MDWKDTKLSNFKFTSLYCSLIVNSTKCSTVACPNYFLINKTQISQ